MNKVFYAAAILLTTGFVYAQMPGNSDAKKRTPPQAAAGKSVVMPSDAAKFRFIKEYGSDRELKIELYKGRAWLDKTENGFVAYDDAGKAKTEIKKKLSTLENPTDEQIGEKRYRRTHADILGDNEGALISEQEFQKDSGGSGHMFSSSWTIYDSSGREKAKFSDNRHYVPAPDGKYFIGMSYLPEIGSDSALKFVNDVGKTIKEIKPFDWVGEGRVVFSEDGSYGVYLHGGMDIGGMTVFDSTGNILGKYTEKGWDPIGPFEVGPGHVLRPLERVLPITQKVLVVGTDMKLTCFDFGGNKLWTRDYSSLSTSVGYGNMCLAVHPTKNICLVFNIKRADSHVEVIDATTGQEIGRHKLTIYNAPASPNKISPDYPEKPWDHVITYIVKDLVVLAYADARTAEKKIISGAMLFNFFGEKVDEVYFQKPEVYWADKEGNFYVQEAEGIKQWKIE